MDFSQARTPNFAQALIGGHSAGLAVGQERARAALEQRQLDMQDRAMEARRRVFAAPDTAPALPAAPPTDGAALAGPDAQAAPPVPMRQDGLMVNQAALREYAAIDPDGAIKLADFAFKADKQKIEQAKAHGELKARAAFALRRVPAGPQREAAFAAMKPELASMGFAESDLMQARIDDASLDKDIAFGMTISDLISADDKTRNFDAQQADRAADNSRADRSLASQEQARAAALNIARQREARAGRSGGGSGGGSGAGSDNSDLSYLMGSN